MDSMKFRREDVLTKLKENRTKHETAFKDAEEGFHEAVIKDLTEALKLAKAGKEYRTSIKQTKPVHYLKNYDRAIQMFEMTSDAQVELSEHEFTQFVMDEWQWKETFTASARAYGKGSY